MSNIKLILSAIKFLKDESKKEEFSADSKESLEVAVECLQAAYDIDPSDPSLSHLHMDVSLADIFRKATLTSEPKEKIEPSEAIQKAEKLKQHGNDLMKAKQYTEAVSAYTSAIHFDSGNAVYYGNRAAAYGKLDDFQNAIKDCQKALEIDPNYAKAYGRMGLAHASLKQFDQAVNCYKKALEIDPTNEDYQNYLKVEQERIKEKNKAGFGGIPVMGNFDWQGIFSNPAFRNMASSIMQDPNIMNVISANAPSSSSQSVPGADPLNAGGNSFLEAGRYLAAQMQAANPELVDQLRQFASRNPNQNEDSSDSTTK